mmetsp:Transcript_37511/g.74441  ORF Transcript_37511/g.74441 Transcript_37511/m.74441 type:complete len:375 (+) Transcript_37511:41-1165(+)
MEFRRLSPSSLQPIQLDSDSDVEFLDSNLGSVAPFAELVTAKSEDARTNHVLHRLIDMGFGRHQVQVALGSLSNSAHNLVAGECDALVISRIVDLLEARSKAPSTLQAQPCAHAKTSQGQSKHVVKRRKLEEQASTWPLHLHVEQQPYLPQDLILQAQPLVHDHSAGQQTLLHIRNVDGCQGRLVAGRVLSAMLDAFGYDFRQSASRRRGKREGIVADHKHPLWHTNPRLSVLQDLGDQLLAFLVANGHISSSQARERPWNDSEVLVYNPGCVVRRHRDAQPPGSLLFVFCAGLAAQSEAWPGGSRIESRLESGDCVVMDGTRTEHAVTKVFERSSPFTGDVWLGAKRLAVLVRQAPPWNAGIALRRGLAHAAR